MADKLTTKQAADRLGITAQAVGQAIRRGMLPAEWNSYARRWEIKLEEVEAYRREHARPQEKKVK